MGRDGLGLSTAVIGATVNRFFSHNGFGFGSDRFWKGLKVGGGNFLRRFHFYGWSNARGARVPSQFFQIRAFA